MGMFDYVNFKMPCPKCGVTLQSFQTKDLSCDMVSVEPDGLSRFYDKCFACKAWVEFSREHEPAPPRPIPLQYDDIIAMGFKMDVTEGTVMAAIAKESA